MYASVTDIIPNMDDHSKISGRILHLSFYSSVIHIFSGYYFTLTLINYRYCG